MSTSSAEADTDLAALLPNVQANVERSVGTRASPGQARATISAGTRTELQDTTQDSTGAARRTANLADLLADEEAVVEGIELLALRQFIGGSNKADEGHGEALVAVVEEALVQEGEQRVQDRTVGLEDLVYKRDLCLHSRSVVQSTTDTVADTVMKIFICWKSR